MSFPASGYIKIYPDNTTIVQGINGWSLNSDAHPQPTRDVSHLDAYFDTRITDLALAPCIRRADLQPDDPDPGDEIYVPYPNTYELSFSASSLGLEFYYPAYPGTPIGVADFLSPEFPVGLVISQLMVGWTGRTWFGPARNRDIQQLSLKYFGSTVKTYVPALIPAISVSLLSDPGAIIPFLANWSPLQAFKPFGVTIPVTDVISEEEWIPESVTSECFLLGVYNTQRFAFNNGTPMAIPGDIVDITNDMENFDVFSDYKLYWDPRPEEPGYPEQQWIYIPAWYFYIRTPYRIRFRMPEEAPYGGRRFTLRGIPDGVSFVGEVDIAQLNILLVDGSGVYELTNGQRHDTYYDRATETVGTIDLKFPRPRFRTGFF